MKQYVILYNVTTSLYIYGMWIYLDFVVKVEKTNRKVEIYIGPIFTSIFSLEIYHSFTEQQRNRISVSTQNLNLYLLRKSKRHY